MKLVLHLMPLSIFDSAAFCLEGGERLSYVTEDMIKSARQVDLLTYLQTCEPSELVHIYGQTYCTKEHDSLKISNGKWHWFSRGIGGVTALDYLTKVKGFSLPRAVETILNVPISQTLDSYKQEKPVTRKLVLPEKNDSAECVIRYLKKRGIHPAIIDYCLDHQLLYESKVYHNAVFLGYDEKGQPRYAALRGTIGNYKGEASGSDKHYSFRIRETKSGKDLHLFEAAIDLLSYATMMYLKGRDWKQDALLSLAGVFHTKRNGVLPVALSHYLDHHPEVKTIHLHLDNDDVGRGASEGIMERLKGRYVVLNEPPEHGKDVNEQLMRILGTTRTEEHER